jgi:hypothetical protein
MAKEIKLQCIYTFRGGLDQVMIDFHRLPKTAMENERNFLVVALDPLREDEMQNLVKISACVSMEIEPPKWYMECNGKFYFN